MPLRPLSAENRYSSRAGGPAATVGAGHSARSSTSSSAEYQYPAMAPPVKPAFADCTQKELAKLSPEDRKVYKE